MAHLKHTTWQTQRGLTLVELMVTIAVIAILATTAVSTMSNMRAKQQVIAAAEEVASVIIRVKALARKQSSDIDVEFLPHGKNKQFGLTSISSASGTVAIDLGLTHSKVKFASSREDQILGFDSVRGIAKRAGSICIAADTDSFDESDYEVKVVYSPEGRVRICNRKGVDRYQSDDCSACQS